MGKTKYTVVLSTGDKMKLNVSKHFTNLTTAPSGSLCNARSPECATLLAASVASNNPFSG